jgi:hypothetical protein
LESDLTFTCIIIRKRDGLGITLVFCKLVDLYQELSPVNNENARMTAHYCGSCLVFVLCRFASFDADLVLCVHELEQVERYLYDGCKVRPSRVKAKDEAAANDGSHLLRKDWQRFIGPIDAFGGCNPYQGNFTSLALPYTQRERISICAYFIECMCVCFAVGLVLITGDRCLLVR